MGSSSIWHRSFVTNSPSKSIRATYNLSTSGAEVLN
uniref:Uncharacterized protein n=1 Tax=Rhizophora mucronata TaxID=61149 RepID=A0A2P2NSH4_RHIMU